jgi:hypothetical protein
MLRKKREKSKGMESGRMRDQGLQVKAARPQTWWQEQEQEQLQLVYNFIKSQLSQLSQFSQLFSTSLNFGVGSRLSHTKEVPTSP